MARLSRGRSQRLERVEGGMACLGNARVLLGLVYERVHVAAQMSAHPGVLLPALADLRQVDELIVRAQQALPSERGNE